MTLWRDEYDGEEDWLFLDDEEFYLDDEGDEDDEDGQRSRPPWLHPDCVNVCTALELGTCCKYPDNPLVHVAVDLADAVDRAFSGADGAAGRLLACIPGLLAQVHAILPRLNETAVAQLLCPVGRLADALDEEAGQSRRADLETLRPLLAECATAIRTALGWPCP